MRRHALNAAYLFYPAAAGSTVERFSECLMKFAPKSQMGPGKLRQS